MAERFGAKYSPGAEPAAAPAPFAKKRRGRAGMRANFLFVAPFVFLLTAFGGTPVGLALDLGAFGLLMLAAWLTREGLAAQEAYDARRVARRPAIPRKLFGAAATGLGLLAGGYVPGVGLVGPVLLGLIGAVLHVCAFGPDPLRDKGLDTATGYETDRVAKVVTGAETDLAAMEAAIARLGDRDLAARAGRFAAHARAMFRRVEDDPRDLNAARKYLGVYLRGARDAATKFEGLGTDRTAEDRARFTALLGDLETRFAARTATLAADNRLDLAVEVDVLRERLAQDGIQTRD